MVDVSVLILFFNRPEALGRVWRAVRVAQPARLFLYQDGPRSDKDRRAMEACRRIVADVDWSCEVRRNYREENSGCNPSNFLAQRWAFGFTDKCIVLEDDSVPSASFFPFCKEMLDRYESDQRIALISGLNYQGTTTDCPYSYLFTSALSIWGWATWRRVVDEWDPNYGFMDDSHAMQLLRRYIKHRHLQSDIPRSWSYRRATGKPYYVAMLQASMLLGSRLAIVPRTNLIANLGPEAGESVHYTRELRTLPRAMRRLLQMPAHELDFPLRHPRYMIEDVRYRETQYRIFAWEHPWRKSCRSLEELWLNIKAGHISHIFSSIALRLRAFAGRRHYD